MPLLPVGEHGAVYGDLLPAAGPPHLCQQAPHFPAAYSPMAPMSSGAQSCGAAGPAEAFVVPSAVGGVSGSYSHSQLPFNWRRKSVWASFVPSENPSRQEGACDFRCTAS